MSLRLEKAAARAEGMSRRAKAVLLFLAHAANDKTGRCWPSQETIAAKVCASRRTVIRAMAELEAAGWIERERRIRRDGSRTSDLVTVFDPLERAKAEERLRMLPLMVVMSGGKPCAQPVENTEPKVTDCHLGQGDNLAQQEQRRVLGRLNREDSSGRRRA